MLHNVMALNEISVGSQKVVQVGNIHVLLCHTETGVYAVENNCPHAAMPLEGGRIVGDVIRCPSHGAKFNLKTGKPVIGARLEPVKIFDVTIIDERINIDFPDTIVVENVV